MRPTIVDDHDYFMGFARQAATRATCPRKHVGAVLVRDGHLLSSGYNGSICGLEHCEDVGCLIEDNHCVRCIHAEANAILQAAKRGTAVGGATLYVTASPCWPCFGLVVNVGVRRVVFGEAYRAEDPGPQRVLAVAERVGVEVMALSMLTEFGARVRLRLPALRQGNCQREVLRVRKPPQ